MIFLGSNDPQKPGISDFSKVPRRPTLCIMRESVSSSTLFFFPFEDMRDQLSFDDQEDVIRLRGAWDQVLRRLNDEVQSSVIERFLSPLKPTQWADGVVTFEAPGQFVEEWVRDKFQDRLETMISEELGEPVRLRLRVVPREKPASESSVFVSASVATESSKFRPNDRFRFENFIVGQSNRMAVAGAKAVAQSPGTKYNPLFIYGSSGYGKTHLLHAIAHSILGRDTRYPLLYMSGQQFAEEFVDALKSSRIEQFRRMHRSVSLWLIDDIQFIVGREKTQEEIFHTFNYLQQTGKQIVFCSDRPPRDLFLMDERLRSRFESGLVVDIQPPDTETRCAILLSKAERDGIALSHDLAMQISTQVQGNIRVLEGALTKIAAQASLDIREIDADLVREIIDRYYQSASMARPGIDQILDAVSKHFHISVEEIQGPSRKGPITHARHVAVYIAREITHNSWKHIGSQLGDRDHTSIMHAHAKISSLITRDRETQTIVRTLMQNLYPDA